ncbi:hypothetical protein ACET3X_006809 [Alternaria dauci]|uniref:Killer toxin Kp4 domain-containing protein n=1 Tax=Alternaria dauci TaxID=48095 RepID=A0ABR3UEU2_9PLEO
MKATILNIVATVIFWATAVFALAAIDNGLQPPVARDLDAAPGINLDEAVPQVSPDQTTHADIPYETFPASGNSTDVHTLGHGINCKGSSQCKYCKASLDQILATLRKIPDNVTFMNGEKIACQTCDPEHIQGICVFARNLHMEINAKDARQIVQRLRDHSCGRCGSVPIHKGADLEQGMITANYVTTACVGDIEERGWGCPKNKDNYIHP